MKIIMTVSVVLVILSIPVTSAALGEPDQTNGLGSKAYGGFTGAGLNGYAQSGGVFTALSAVTTAGSTSSMSAVGYSGALTSSSSGTSTNSTDQNTFDGVSSNSFNGSSSQVSLQTTGAVNVQLLAITTGTVISSTAAQ